jgi:tetratricopeptide (TPR) repeat protein
MKISHSLNSLSFRCDSKLLLLPIISLILLIFSQLSFSQETNTRISNLQTIYLDALADEMFDEADQIAKKIVEQSIQKYGIDSHEAADSLIKLAIAQQGQKKYESAVLNYEAAISAIQRIENRLDKRLINPLRGLAETQIKMNRMDLARDNYNRAIHISHVNDGPHNLEQLENLQSLANVYVIAKEPKNASDIEKRIYYLQSRNIEPFSLEMIPALKTLAKSQRKSGLFEKERKSWRRIISITQKQKGKDSLDLIEPLTELGKTYLFVHFNNMGYDEIPTVSKGDTYLKKAIRIAEKNPEATWQDVTETKIILADYYIMSDRANRSYNIYREIWDLLSEDELKLEFRALSLEQPVILEDIYPPKFFEDTSITSQEETPPGYEKAQVTFNYNVSKRGLAKNINRASFKPDGLDFMHNIIGKEIRKLVYRPRFYEREPVITQNVIFEHEFFYKKNNASVQKDSE